LIAISVNAHAGGLTENARHLLESNSSTGSARSRFLRTLLSPERDRWRDLTQGLKDLWQDDPWLLEQEMFTIVTPTLIIAGSNDDVHRRHLDEMATAMPFATLRILPGIGHAVPQSAPAKVLQLMTEFLNASTPQITKVIA
jgi:pimeloyl-ACP methyl ester carboxylesterase